MEDRFKIIYCMLRGLIKPSNTGYLFMPEVSYDVLFHVQDALVSPLVWSVCLQCLGSTWFEHNNQQNHSSSGDDIIISQNSSKSMVPDPSSSISAMIPSRSTSDKFGSTSARISRN
eukprot:GFUD01123720.1.p1 GENE.GFUD01123720.1~~GFUD01123720.1.p1  ORF type:complete len:116 (+),score=3.93 GFUD01123720.1:160-507(+)